MAFIHIEKESILLQGQKCIITKNTFIADTGATSHMRYSLAGMYDMHPHVTEITVGNSEVMLSKQRGKFKGLVTQQDGSSLEILLEEVLYVPKLYVNLFSLTKPLLKPTSGLSSTKEGLINLHLGKEMITFDKVVAMVLEDYWE